MSQRGLKAILEGGDVRKVVKSIAQEQSNRTELKAALNKEFGGGAYVLVANDDGSSTITAKPDSELSGSKAMQAELLGILKTSGFPYKVNADGSIVVESPASFEKNNKVNEGEEGDDDNKDGKDKKDGKGDDSDEE